MVGEMRLALRCLSCDSEASTTTETVIGRDGGVRRKLFSRQLGARGWYEVGVIFREELMWELK